MLQALVRQMQNPFHAPGFETHLTQHFRNQGSPNFGASWLSAAVGRAAGPRLLVAEGQVDEILRSNRSPQEKTEDV
jgi:hypothetical protein